MRRKIFDRSELIQLIAERRNASSKPLRFVFTNGCFDLMHVGHARYLYEARKQGDALIVALNDDASIRRIKGESRPILKLAERMQVMSGLGCVDYVTSFHEDTPIPLLRELKPQVLVKGGTYDLQGIVGHDVVTEWGAEVRPLNVTQGISTTGLIEKVLGMRKV